MTRPWRRTINGVGQLLADYDGSAFEETRDAVVRLLRKEEPYKRYLNGELRGEGSDGAYGDAAFHDAVEEMAEACTEEEFDSGLEDLYDWADENRVWIDPLPA